MKSRYIRVLSGLLLVGTLGCQSATQTIRKSESKSPDGGWLVLTHTENTDGPGINAQYTTIEMKQSFDGAKPVEILVFDEGSEEAKDIKANWVSPSHLNITYRGNPEILFQAIKAFGMDVSLERLTN
jgi:hypothetical protein